jgi:predicted DNA-binding protein
MSDLLVNQLWESDEASALTNQAARRIEELDDIIRHDRERIEELVSMVNSKDDRIEELEAKLAKAVEALDRIQDGSYGKLAAKARTILAELKGEDQ